MNEVFIVAYSRSAYRKLRGCFRGFYGYTVRLNVHQVGNGENQFRSKWSRRSSFWQCNIREPGQAPVKQAALGAGIPNKANCTLINKVCSSGNEIHYVCSTKYSTWDGRCSRCRRNGKYAAIFLIIFLAWDGEINSVPVKL